MAATCIARTVDQKWFFDSPARRDHIQKIIQASAILKGANVLNFVVMSNIHVLVQIRSQSSLKPLTKATVLEQAQALYSKAYVADLKQEFFRAEKIDSEAGDN